MMASLSLSAAYWRKRTATRLQVLPRFETHRVSFPRIRGSGCRAFRLSAMPVSDLILFPVSSSCSVKPNNCRLLQLSVLEDVLDVLADRPLCLTEELCELLLAEPDGLILEANVELGSAVLALVD